ncbi:hypothetical protein [Nocardioides sp.]|uniref:PspA-associated protein PspAA n=1 Tax=Nocardioides sp. TaxID=35761 RepID=UPI00198DAF0F|nr:hypothetical protein [Nocardioides sp.]MBC7275968.1 hypothetical protein [Nocardioides sp.]
MIVRILGEGQYDLDASAIDKLNELDAAVEAACQGTDEAVFDAALVALLEGVRSMGTAHPVDAIDSSDLILPGPGSTLAEVSEMLGDEGLIPG